MGWGQRAVVVGSCKVWVGRALRGSWTQPVAGAAGSSHKAGWSLNLKNKE